MYVKLFGTILDSSIWEEDSPTRIVWITMLAMAGPDGVVRASPGGLARRACVSRAECKHALEVLAAPDVESRSQEYGGRRIERIDGGWLLLNYEKYRELRTQQQVTDALRQQRHRDKSRDIRTSPEVTGEEEESSEVVSSPSPSVRTVTFVSDALLLEEDRAAFMGLVRASHNPVALAATVGSFGPGGIEEMADWRTIGKALRDAATSADGKVTANFIRGCIRKAKEGPKNGRGKPTRAEAVGAATQQAKEELKRDGLL